MQKIKIDISRYKKKETRKQTRWQDEVAQYIKNFNIVQTMQPYVWKKVGKNGKNFSFIESQVAKINEWSVYYKKDLKEYSGNFINILKKLK